MTDAYDCILAAIATSFEDDPVASRLNSIQLALDDLLEMSRNEHHREQVLSEAKSIGALLCRVQLLASFVDTSWPAVPSHLRVVR